MIFDENGLVELQRNIFESESLQGIMKDGHVSEQELEEQNTAVCALLKDLKDKFSNEQLSYIDTLMREYGVLMASTVFHNFKSNSFGK